MTAIMRHNPIVQAEFRYQRWIINKSRAGWLWIALAAALVIPALLLSLFSVGWYLVVPHVDSVPEAIASLYSPGPAIVILLVANLSMYPVVTLITYGLSALSISRERQGHTWELLRLTGVEEWQIVGGKWWASLRALLGDHAMVGVLQAGLMVALALLFARYPWVVPVEVVAPVAPLFDIVLILATTTALTAFDAGLSAALAIFGAVSASDLRIAIGAGAFALRTLVIGLAMGLWVARLMALLGGDLLGFVALAGLMALIYTLAIGAVLALALRLMRTG